MSVKYVNTNMYYIGNRQNDVYGGKNVVESEITSTIFAINTGWHFIPNQYYTNFLTPRQWFDLVTNHSEFKLDKVEVIIQNMIPLTDNLSIEQNTTFMTFNNTIYALAFQDNHYLTNFGEEQTNLLWREGVEMKQSSDTDTPTIKGKLYLPIYTHYLPTERVSGVDRPYGLFAWDPLVDAENLQELRPGKNAVTFSWTASEDHWTTTAAFSSYNNFQNLTNRPYFFKDDNVFNEFPLTPSGHHRKVVRTIQDQLGSDTWGPITQSVYWQKPIPNFFIKMLPIFDTKGNLMKHEGQIVLTRKIYFSVKPRAGGMNFPQLASGYCVTRPYNFSLKDNPHSAWYNNLAYGTFNRTTTLRSADPASIPTVWVKNPSAEEDQRVPEDQ